MERLCGKGSGENLTVSENIHVSKCSLDLTQLFLNLFLVNIIAVVYASQRCFRTKRKTVINLFSHHNWTWNLTFILFLCTAAMCAEGWIVLFSSPNLSGLEKMFKALIFSSSNSDSTLNNNNNVTSDTLKNLSGDTNIGGLSLDLSAPQADNISAYLLLFVLTPTSLLFVLLLASCLYHQCEARYEPRFLWVNIIFFLISSVLSFAKLYLHLVDGLSITHVQVFANIFSSFATGILASLLVHTYYIQTRKKKTTTFYPVDQVNLKNVKYLHFYSALLSRITFFWITPLLRLGYNEPLEEEDLGQLPPEEKTAYQFERFHKHFLEEKEASSAETRPLNLWKCMSKTIWPTLVAGGFFRLAADCSGFVAPLGIKTIVSYASRNTSAVDLELDMGPNTTGEFGIEYLTVTQLLNNGYVMALIILLSALLQSTFSQSSTFLVNAEGIHLKIALQTLIYKKSLTLCTTKSSATDQSSSASSENGEGDDHENKDDGGGRNSPSTNGDASEDSQSNSASGFDKGSISNLMSEDTNNIMLFWWNFHFIWAIPLKLAILMVLLYLQLGYSALIGSTVCVIVMIPLQYLIIAKYMSSNSAELMERCDERLRSISEILQGIKLLKLQGWELIFSQQVIAIRQKELRNLDKDMLYRSIMTFLTHISTVVVTLVTFGLYSYIEEDKLEPSTVFAGIALFNQLLVPLFVFPNTVPVIIDALVSVRRVREFLQLPEATPLQYLDDPADDATKAKNDREKEEKSEEDGKNKVNGSNKAKAKKKKKSEEESSNEPGKEKVKGPETSLNIPQGDLTRGPSSDSVFCSHQSLENIVEDEEIDDDDEEEEDDDDDNEEDSEAIVSPETTVTTFDVSDNIKETAAITTVATEQPASEKPESTEETISKEAEDEVVVAVRNGEFSWDSERHDYGLTDINLKIPKEKLTVVVGELASGKSSLIFALLGEMRRVAGDVRWARGATIAYVGQKPWILGCSVRDNITFGTRYKPRRYLKVVEACALQEDINILPEKDATDLSGINLSGGQRQRLAIARAIYSDANVVILDDPLSALDVDVAHHLFDTGIRKFLLRSKRTVILVTHHLPVLHHAHHIISMEKGRIRIQGALENIKVEDPKLHKIWIEIMTKKEAEIIKQQEAKTAKERWSLLKLISKIGLQFKHRNSDAGSWKVNDDAKVPALDSYRKRKGTFSHYKNLSYDIFSPGDEHHDELMTPLLRRRCVSRTSRESRTSSSSNKHPELMRMTSLQNDSTVAKTKSPLLVKKFQRLQSLPVTDDEPLTPLRPPSSPTLRSRSGSGSGNRLKENMFKKMFHTKKTNSVGSSSSDLEKNPDTTTGRLPSTVSGISEGEEDDEDVEESMLVQQSRDEREYGTIPVKVYLSYIAACGNFLSLGYLFLSIGYEVIRVYTTFWLSNWSDAVSRATNDNYDSIMSYHFNIYTILSLITVIVSLTCNLVGKKAGANSREIFHSRMLDRIVRCPMRFYDSNPTGRIITRFSSDMAFIDRKLCIAMQRFLQFVFLCASAIVVNAIVNPWILLGAFPVIAIYFYIQRFYRFSSRELQRLEAISRGPIYNHFHETLEGLSTIRAYKEQNRFTNQMLDKIEANNRAAMFINVGNRWLSTSLDYLGSIMVFLATLAAMISSYLYPELITPSMVGLAINYILLVPVYLNQVVKFLAEVEMFMNSVERVNRYSELEIENYDEENESWPVLSENWPESGQVEFDNISVQYGPDRPPIINDLKVRISPKTKVGVCGRSGSGKSTLLMSLFRITEISKGRILIDGVDIHKVPLIKLRSSLSIIPQENILFSGTIRFNLDPKNKANDTDIWRALELCQMKDTVKELPGQLDADVKDGGQRFSAGQKQLLGLARAILHKSKLVIMDEATSNVDLATERTLLEVVKDVFKDCTVLTIAHRLDAIVDGDRVLVLDQGKVAEDGPPSQLRKKRLSIFASMLRNSEEHNNIGGIS